MTDLSWLQSDELKTIFGILGVILLILLFDRIFKHFLKRTLASLARDRDNWVFSFLQDQRFVFWVLSLPYLAIVHQGIGWIPNLPPEVVVIARRLIGAGFVLLGLFIFSNALRIVNEIYSRTSVSRQRPIKGYLQSLLIIAYFFGFICILSLLLDKSPIIFLSGLGALTAVLLLVFKDTILSLVAGVQLTTNDLIRVGDWIEMPQFNADGDVLEIALHSVKVQNWDRTTTVIPAHKFLENSFKNWRGMQDSGGRRIKRSINVDVNSIRFLNSQDVERLSKIKLLEKYLSNKVSEIEAHNNQFGQERGPEINLRRLTNIGTFRAYITEYLKNHPKIHKDRTFLVRQLAPGAEGLPIEIYVFANDIRWPYYEGIQADIFDHLLAVMPEFDLHFFQKPSGKDLKELALLSRPQ